MILGLDFKQFVPEKEPFKVFTTPNYPQIIMLENKAEDALIKEVTFSELDHMPIMKSDAISEAMPFFRPNNKIKYSLLTVDPLKKEEVLVPKK